MGLLGDVVSPAASLSGDALNSFTGDSNTLGDMLTGGAASNLQAVDATNAAQIQLAQQQMAFQAQMSDTSYQRAVTDMKDAGLNPMLAYSNGGASTPSGAMAQLQTPQPGAIGAGLTNTAKSLFSMYQGATAQNKQNALTDAQADLAGANSDYATAHAKESSANTDLSNMQTKIATEKYNQAQMDTQVQQARQSADVRLAPVDAVMERVGQATGAIGNAFRIFSGGSKSSGSKTETYNGSGEMTRSSHTTPLP